MIIVNTTLDITTTTSQILSVPKVKHHNNDGSITISSQVTSTADIKSRVSQVTYTCKSRVPTGGHTAQLRDGGQGRRHYPYRLSGCPRWGCILIAVPLPHPPSSCSEGGCNDWGL